MGPRREGLMLLPGEHGQGFAGQPKAHAVSPPQSFALRLASYPSSMALALRVGWAGVEGEAGTLLCTGSLGAPPVEGEAAAPTEPSSAASSSGGAFALDLTQRPADGSADAVVSVGLAPSYLSYDARVVSAVSAFFASDTQLGLSALQASGAVGPPRLVERPPRVAHELGGRSRSPDAAVPCPTAQAQAAARAAELQRLAALRLRELSRTAQRPRLALSVVLEAPKIAVPDAQVRSGGAGAGHRGARSASPSAGLFVMSSPLLTTGGSRVRAVRRAAPRCCWTWAASHSPQRRSRRLRRALHKGHSRQRGMCSWVGPLRLTSRLRAGAPRRPPRPSCTSGSRCP
jgi:hypothetical protein